MVTKTPLLLILSLLCLGAAPTTQPATTQPAGPKPITVEGVAKTHPTILPGVDNPALDKILESLPPTVWPTDEERRITSDMLGQKVYGDRYSQLSGGRALIVSAWAKANIIGKPITITGPATSAMMATGDLKALQFHWTKNPRVIVDVSSTDAHMTRAEIVEMTGTMNSLMIYTRASEANGNVYVYLSLKGAKTKIIPTAKP